MNSVPEEDDDDEDDFCNPSLKYRSAPSLTHAPLSAMVAAK